MGGLGICAPGKLTCIWSCLVDSAANVVLATGTSIGHYLSIYQNFFGQSSLTIVYKPNLCEPVSANPSLPPTMRWSWDASHYSISPGIRFLFVVLLDRFNGMANLRRSWLDGPEIPADYDDPDAPGRWPGEKLGLPEKGKGSLVSVARRIGGVCIDWGISWMLAIVLTNFTDFLGDVATSTLIIFLVMGWLSGWFFARTPGHAMLGMGIARVDAADRVGWWRALARSVLTIFILPAAMVDTDGRGLHDKATGTAIIRG